MEDTQREPGLDGSLVCLGRPWAACSGFILGRCLTWELLQPLQRAAGATADVFYPLKMSPPHLSSQRAAPCAEGCCCPQPQSQSAQPGTSRINPALIFSLKVEGAAHNTGEQHAARRTGNGRQRSGAAVVPCAPRWVLSVFPAPHTPLVPARAALSKTSQRAEWLS